MCPFEFLRHSDDSDDSGSSGDNSDKSIGSGVLCIPLKYFSFPKIFIASCIFLLSNDHKIIHRHILNIAVSQLTYNL